MALTGFNPPVVRAGMLMIFVFLGMLSEKEADSLNSIGLAVTVMILINPYAAFSKSLWLSVFASTGIIILSGKMKPESKDKQSKNKLINLVKTFVIDSVAVSLSVALFTLPLTLVFFDRFSLVTPVANLVLIEISSLSMLLTGFAVLFFLTGLHFISYPLFFLSSFLARIITGFALSLSKLPFITIGTDWRPLRIITVLIPLFAVIIYLLKKYKKDKLLKAFSVLVAVSFVTVCVMGIINEQRRTRIYLPAVGNGMCVAVVDKKNTAVIGCGGNYFAYSSFCDIMEKEGISKLDFVFVPSENKSVYSFFDDITNGFDIDTLKSCEYGSATLESGTQIECSKDYAFINCHGVSVLAVFNYNFNTGSLPESFRKADYLITRYALPKGCDENSFGQTIVLVEEPENNIQNIKYAGNEIICLEVEQNGRARFETANQR